MQLYSHFALLSFYLKRQRHIIMYFIFPIYSNKTFTFSQIDNSDFYYH